MNGELAQRDNHISTFRPSSIMPHDHLPRTDHERPETYPVYGAVRTVQWAEFEKPTLVGLKPTGLDTHFPDALILHHDLAGRLLRIARPNIQWRRGLSGRMIELCRRTRERGGGLERRALNRGEVDRWIDEAAARMRLVAGRLRADVPVSTSPAAEMPVTGAAMSDTVDAAARFDASRRVSTRHSSRRSTTTCPSCRPTSTRRWSWSPATGVDTTAARSAISTVTRVIV